MRVSVLRGVEDVVTEDRPTPSVGADEVLVRVTAVGVCGSDVHYYRHGRIGDFVVRDPLVLGHESGGRVEAVGSAVTRVAVGDRVSVEPGVPCRHCEQCLAGRYNLCPDVRFFATPPIDGAFCEYVAVPEPFVYPVPDSMTDDEAALIEPLSVGVAASRKAGVGPGDRVLVTGAGPIGLLAAQVARAFGAGTVWVSDVSAFRLGVAADLGLVPVDVGAGTLADAGVEPDVLIECSGHPQATWDAIRAVRPAGRVVLVGMGGDELRLPLSVVQNRELTVTGTFRYANTWPTAIELVTGGRVDLAAVVTHHFPLERAEEALTAGQTDPTAIKVMVLP